MRKPGGFKQFPHFLRSVGESLKKHSNLTKAFLPETEKNSAV
jgi:hypothetical protein